MSLVEKLKSQMSLPVIGAPMFIVGNPDLVIGQCVSGIIGSFPALNARPAEVLDEWLVKIKASDRREIENLLTADQYKNEIAEDH